MPSTTVLVAGATGFIAAHCIKELLTRGYKVRGTVRNNATANVAHLNTIAQSAGGELELSERPWTTKAGPKPQKAATTSGT